MKILETVLKYLPIISLIGTLALWADTRYMHTDISDQRHLDLKIEFYERLCVQLDRKMDKEAYIPSKEEWREYEGYKNTVKLLKHERDKLIGLAE